MRRGCNGSSQERAARAAWGSLLTVPVRGDDVGYQTRSLLRALSFLDAFSVERPTLGVKDSVRAARRPEANHFPLGERSGATGFTSAQRDRISARSQDVRARCLVRPPVLH